VSPSPRGRGKAKGGKASPSPVGSGVSASRGITSFFKRNSDTPGPSKALCFSLSLWDAAVHSKEVQGTPCPRRGRR